MRRVGLGRRRMIGGDAGDPLAGIVNLFDIGLVLAAAALIGAAGLIEHEPRPPRARTTPLATPTPATPRARGPGRAVGTVYRLADGRLVYVHPRR